MKERLKVITRLTVWLILVAGVLFESGPVTAATILIMFAALELCWLNINSTADIIRHLQAFVGRKARQDLRTKGRHKR